jgi:hypothetical protein
LSYDASAVKIYRAVSSLVRFGNKHVFFYFEKNARAYAQSYDFDLQRQPGVAGVKTL